MSEARKVSVVVPGRGESVAVVGDLYTFLAAGEETGGRFAAVEALVLPGGGPPPHVHSREDESFYVLEGEITFYTGFPEAVKTVGTKGSFVNIPPGVAHCFRNESAAEARMLIVVSPAGFEKFFAEVGTVVTERPARPLAPTPRHIEEVLAAAPRYGVVTLPRFH